MTQDLRLAGWKGKAAGLWMVVALLTGCQGVGRQVGPATIDNPTLGSMTVAVAPAVNLSGSKDFDPSRFADLMASEFSYAEGVSVIPVSRVLGVLGAQGVEQVESPTHALELTELLGADAILVFSVTEYDPYDPPSLGISAQLFGRLPNRSGGRLDPVDLSRRTNLAASQASAGSRRLLAQTQRVFDAAHGSVVDDIRAFARFRGGDGSPYGWRKYVASQQHFIRYCCVATIRALLSNRQGSGLPDGAPEGKDTDGHSAVVTGKG